MAQLTKRLLLLLLVLSASCFADTVKPDAEPGFHMLDDLPVANQIPLLENRFRIDDGIESITMVLFRRQGTSSIVLVRPDGSKIFYNTAKQHNIRWHDEASYDLIEIANPMPGPWQALGRILPESKILVLTDVELDADPLPESLMVGENFKLTARLKDGEQIVNARDFKDILLLQVIFISTNNKEHENFGRGIVEVATFRDDGRGYDASARDGIFTGEIKLNFGAGEWIPKFTVKTPLYTREIELAPIIIEPAPVAIAVTAAQAEQTHHLVKLEPTTTLVDLSSLLFQGQVNYPDGSMDVFAITEPGQALQFAMENRGHGSYILNISVFGQMANGREFVLNLPEERFLVTLQARDAPALAELPPEIPLVNLQEPEIPEKAPFPWLWVIAINVFILLIGAMAIWFVLSGKSMTALLFWRKKSTSPAVNGKGEPAVESKKVQKNNDSDGILDLSLPDD